MDQEIQFRPVYVYNNLTKQKEPLVGSPKELDTSGRSLTWYTCGPTVYDVSHIGHARNYVSFDIIRRVLEDVFGYEIKLQMNVTDLDDKIIIRSNENGESFTALSRRMEAEFFRNLDELNCRRPTIITRVSEYIPDVVTYIEKIIQNGYAYSTPSGSVYFDTEAFKKAGFQYAKLEPTAAGNVQLLNEGEGALSAEVSEKKNAADFALWKASKAGEPKWDSTWSKNPGRPGWHIECSAMASTELGCPIDVHSGGVDLKFPHHDNEIAQAEAYHVTHEWVRYWMHSGHLHIEGLKMSKSLKNFISIDACLERYSAAQLRILFLLHKYDAPMSYSEESMLEAVRLHRSFVDFEGTVSAAIRSASKVDISIRPEAMDKELLEFLAQKRSVVYASLADNLNTPDALMALVALVGRTNAYIAHVESENSSRKYVNVPVISSVLEYVKSMLNIFGVSLGKTDSADSAGKEVESILDAFGGFRNELRNSALSAKAASRSNRESGMGSKEVQEYLNNILNVCDSVRDHTLPALGVRLEDKADGSFVWKRENAADLMKEQERKKQQELEKAEEKRKAKEREQERLAKEMERASIHPSLMFQTEERKSEFSAWDEDGIPTHDSDKNELSKAARKKLVKEREKHVKLYEKFVSSSK